MAWIGQGTTHTIVYNIINPKTGRKNKKRKDVTVYRTVNDVNGNPRYIVHFLDICSEFDGIGENYSKAIERVHRVGGRKYHNKSFGGGVVFQSYNLQDDISRMLED